MKQVRWTDEAAADLEEIADYLAERDPAAEPDITNRIYEAVYSIARMPHRGYKGRKPGTRELIPIGLPYIVVYTVRADAVIIARILHAARRR